MKQMITLKEAVGMKNSFMMDGGGKRVVCPFRGKSYGNVFFVLYSQLPMERKDTIFGVKYQNIFVGQHLLNYEEMFVVIPI